MVDHRFRKKTFPDTVVLKMLDKVIMEIEQENSLETETRRKHESISCTAAKGQHWRRVECTMGPPHQAWTHKALHSQCEIETNPHPALNITDICPGLSTG